MGDIVSSLLKAFDEFEAKTGRVAAVWLHSVEVQALYRRLDVFDIAANRTIARYMSNLAGAPLMGYVFNAGVFVTDKIKPGYVVLVGGDDFEFGPVDPTMAVPLPPE